MSIQEYISSGIVEAYVLGLASEEEKEEFERRCAESPELRAARDAFELDLEKQGLAAAIPPPAPLRQLVLDRLDAAQAELPEQDAGSPDTPVVVMGQWLRYMAAAAVVLLIGSIVLNVYFFNRYQTYSEQYEALLAQHTELANNQKLLQTQYSNAEAAMAKMRDPKMAVIKMAGTAAPASPAPNSMATVYWDTRTHDVYLQVNLMPPATGEQQYQLWALVDGVPVDAGVFDSNNDAPLIAMKNIPRAQAFAITLEKKGGSSSPNMQQLYVMGKVS